MTALVETPPRLGRFGPRPRPVAERIAGRTILADPPDYAAHLGPCEVWTGARSGSGYPMTSVGSRVDGSLRPVGVHVLVLEHVIGRPLREGMDCAHRCDTPLCVNPDHLFEASRQANMDDARAKGRLNPPRGERCAKAKLTDDDVIEMRRRRAEGVTVASLAKEYGVTSATASAATTGRTWGHL
jgi:hypothetical protein